jgi:uncharacterized protein
MKTSRVARVGASELRLYVPESECQRQIGLGNFERLTHDKGMLFVFPEDGRYGFWMKNMDISIDILWLAKDGTVLHIEPNVSPLSYPTTYVSPVPARYVLELASGAAERMDIHRGSVIVLE